MCFGWGGGGVLDPKGELLAKLAVADDLRVESTANWWLDSTDVLG